MSAIEEGPVLGRPDPLRRLLQRRGADRRRRGADDVHRVANRRADGAAGRDRLLDRQVEGFGVKLAARATPAPHGNGHGIYLAGVFAAKYAIIDRGVTGPLAYAVALVPGLATIGLFWSTGKMIVETEDEFMRMLAVRQQLIAVAFAMAVACVWGTLEMFGLVEHVAASTASWCCGRSCVLIGAHRCNRLTHGGWGQCP